MKPLFRRLMFQLLLLLVLNLVFCCHLSQKREAMSLSDAFSRKLSEALSFIDSSASESESESLF